MVKRITRYTLLVLTLLTVGAWVWSYFYMDVVGHQGPVYWEVASTRGVIQFRPDHWPTRIWRLRRWIRENF